MIYFDNSATTKPLAAVAELAQKELSSDDFFGNPGSIHKLGVKADKAYNAALEKCASLLGAKTNEIYFTSCGTEGANTAIDGFMRRNKRNGKTVISTKTEHKATLEVLGRLEKDGFTVKYINVDINGRPDLEQLKETIDSDTILLCFTHVNNESGAILPLQEIIDLKNSINPSIALYLDCVQSLGKLDINLHKMKVDMATFSGHKIHSVKGNGIMYIRDGIKVDPFILGGGQQRGMRSGTQSLFLANAMKVALEDAYFYREESYGKISEINSYLREELTKRECRILSPDDAIPYVLNVSFKGFESETMLHCLETYDIYVSTISACSSKTKKVSYVLLEMGVDRKTAANSIRLSFSRFNTMDEAREFVNKIDEIYDLYLLKR